jgi:protein pelota
MKQLRQALERDRSGSVQLVAEEAEDLWHVWQLLLVGDLLQCSTIRRVVSESETGSTDKTSVRLTLQVRVEKIDFDAVGGVLRVNGRNLTETKHIKVGRV